jgi:hypothetical protein
MNNVQGSIFKAGKKGLRKGKLRHGTIRRKDCRKHGSGYSVLRAQRKKQAIAESLFVWFTGIK